MCFAFLFEVGWCYNNMAKNWFAFRVAVRKVDALNSRGRKSGCFSLLPLCMAWGQQLRMKRHNCVNSMSRCTHNSSLNSELCMYTRRTFSKANTLNMEFLCWLHPPSKSKSFNLPQFMHGWTFEMSSHITPRHWFRLDWGKASCKCLFIQLRHCVMGVVQREKKEITKGETPEWEFH